MEEGRPTTDTAIHFLYPSKYVQGVRLLRIQLVCTWVSKVPTSADRITQRCSFKRLLVKKQLCERCDHMDVLQRASPSLWNIYLSPHIYTYIHIHTQMSRYKYMCAHTDTHTYIYIIYIYISFPVLGVVTTTLVYKAS